MTTTAIMAGLMAGLTGAASAAPEVALAAGAVPGAVPVPGAASIGAGPWFASLIPMLPLLSCVLCGLCAIARVRSKLPALITVVSLGAAFVFAAQTWLVVAPGGTPHGHGATLSTHLFDWIDFAWGSQAGHRLIANFAFYLDALTMLWMLFVTGLGTLIALYASEYMAHDKGPGYCRFFAYFSLFVFAMSCLVMGDNLLLLYLGWEGVGLCSYLLIGYFYAKPSAVAASKKAFIMNRIGDLGLALAVFTTFVGFGTVEYGPLFDMARHGRDGAGMPIDQSLLTWIPIFFTLGAFGKSAQLFLYVWLPDAMEGPTPVSALIHAATMVTAGVYLVARMYPIYALDPDHTALTVVAWGGAITAFWAATIGMAQFDIKRIMAYSTVSQLGYMFAGLGVMTTVGGAFHVFTHAFFKATLFLCCGAVMHGFGGQLDLRKLSGVQKMKGWGVVSIAMLVGCLNLAGFPFTAGFFSKDMILAQAFITPGAGDSAIIPGASWIGWLLLLTAGLTAYYTFRVYFRVFLGPVHFEPGDEAHVHDAHDDHAHDHDHGHASHGAHASGHGHGSHDAHGAPGASTHGHGAFHPHPPGWAINTVLALLAVLSVAAAGVYFIGGDHGWVGAMVHASTAAYEAPGSHHVGGHEIAGTFLGMDPHKVMYSVSAGVGAVGILAAFILHLAGRTTAATSKADALVPAMGPLARGAQHKWYVDEVYDFLIVKPLWVLANAFHLIDKLLVDGLVNLAGYLPKGLAKGLRPSQNGLLHSYAAGMAGGLAFVLFVVWALS